MLRSPRMLGFATRLALFVPFAIGAAACGDDATNNVRADGGALGEAGPRADGGVDADGSSSDRDAATVPDLDVPTVIATSPAPSAAGASTADAITATFSEAMAPLTLAGATTFRLAQGAVDVPGSATYYDETATFSPSAPLALGTMYTATISTAATDVAGNRLAAAYSWSFTTDPTAPVGPGPVPLGAAGKYVILAKSAVTNVPTSKVTGNVALSPAAATYITGFSLTKAGTTWTTPQVVGSVFAADNDPPTPSNLTTAVGNMETAYTNAAGRSNPTYLDLGAGTLSATPMAPGLYRWASSVTIPTDIVLSGAANDVWIFQVTGDVMMSANKSMTLSGGARAKNVFWQVAGRVDLGTGAHAEGVVLSQTAIALGTGASINGRLLAQTAVSIAGSTVTAPAP